MEESEDKSVESYFVEMEPYYLSIGMTHDQYWYDEPWLAEIYRKAHNLKIEARNQELWLQGLYIHNAFNAVIANFGRGLSGKNGGKPEQYVEKPIRITPLTDAEKRQKEKEDRLKVIAHFTRLQRQFEERQTKQKK